MDYFSLFQFVFVQWSMLDCIKAFYYSCYYYAVAGTVLRKQKGILVWVWPFYGFVLCRGPRKKSFQLVTSKLVKKDLHINKSTLKENLLLINRTSFSVFHTEVNGEYWSQ